MLNAHKSRTDPVGYLSPPFAKQSIHPIPRLSLLLTQHPKEGKTGFLPPHCPLTLTQPWSQPAKLWKASRSGTLSVANPLGAAVNSKHRALRSAFSHAYRNSKKYRVFQTTEQRMGTGNIFERIRQLILFYR